MRRKRGRRSEDEDEKDENKEIEEEEEKEDDDGADEKEEEKEAEMEPTRRPGGAHFGGETLAPKKAQTLGCLSRESALTSLQNSFTTSSLFSDP